MPPDFDELPIPKEIEIQKDIKENKFKALITQDNQEIESNEKDINKNFDVYNSVDEFLILKLIT